MLYHFAVVILCSMRRESQQRNGRNMYVQCVYCKHIYIDSNKRRDETRFFQKSY